MKKVLNTIFSLKATLFLLIVLATGLAAATFIEEKFDTHTAKLLVYNARWFEFLLLMLALNFIGNITRHNLFRLEKAGPLTFHLAFIFLIIGAGITRYTGFEGTMHIREGESSNVIYSSEPHLMVQVEDMDRNPLKSIPFQYSILGRNEFNLKINSRERGPVRIDFRDYVVNAFEKIEENVEGGVNIIELSVLSGRKRQTFYIRKNESMQIGNMVIAYEKESNEEDFLISGKDGQLTLVSPHDIIRTEMHKGIMDTVYSGSPIQFDKNYIYHYNGLMFLFTHLYHSARTKLVSREVDEKGADAMILDVTIEGLIHEAQVFGGPGFTPRYQDYNFGGTRISFAYGDKPIELDFSIFLEDFILERYPGSMSPSSFESDVIIIDSRKDLRRRHKIFMNNVLDYDGYRFFQSSYDSDEKGTVLFVNHDLFGTWVTYSGYLLLGLGFVLTLLSKRSRFQTLIRSIRETRNKRKALLVATVIIFGVNGSAFSQVNGSKAVLPEHAEKFGHLIVQTYEGRFAPVHTLANDVMHKISRLDKFSPEGKGEMNGMQIYLDMLIDVEFWQQQKIIIVREKSVRDIIGIEGKYASFADFFNQQSQYKLREFVETAFRKEQSKQSRFDKEIIKVDERVNICFMIFKGSMLKLFPDQGSLNTRWLSWDDSLAFVPLTGAIRGINEDLHLDVLSYHSLFRKYISELMESSNSGDYERPDQILGYIDNIQRQLAAVELLPSEMKTHLEIYYNKANIFISLKNSYAFLGIILLILSFIANLRSGRSKIIRFLMYIFVSLLAAAFLYHTFGMGLRWYLTGHAPWSNGYEALILIAWGSLLAGFSFIRHSKITLAATALLAFFTLMTASHSSYDPQLTNLQPVLKSYWLIIHVATITISYGFLGLGFMLGLINMFLYLFKSGKNAPHLSLIINELTSVNEMNLIIGVILATVGTFLGGIWANESWGRYWGWDAKETWALIIILTYTIVLHSRFIPRLKNSYVLNAGSIIGFASVIMTFIGVNYYLSKGLHSYASGDTPIFPVWAWIVIISLLLLLIISGIRERRILHPE